MSAIVPFVFEGEAVRAVDLGGETWFVAADVCRVLGVANHRDAIGKLDADERGSVELDTPGGKQSLAAISESGLYTLILRSRAATTPGSVPHRFRRWVTAEVLPAIRKTGGYGAPAIDVRDPKQLAVIATQLLGVNQELQQQVAVMRPKADTFDHLSDHSGDFSISRAASLLRMPHSGLIKLLRRRGWLDRNHDGVGWRAMQSAVKDGYMAEVHVRRPKHLRWKGDATETRPLLTARGMLAIASDLAGSNTPGAPQQAPAVSPR